MKHYFEVTFRWYDTNTYCSNIAHATSKEAAEAHYTEKYGWCTVKECTPWALESAKERGKPIIEIG